MSGHKYGIYEVRDDESDRIHIESHAELLAACQAAHRIQPGPRWYIAIVDMSTGTYVQCFSLR